MDAIADAKPIPELQYLWQQFTLSRTATPTADQREGNGSPVGHTMEVGEIANDLVHDVPLDLLRKIVTKKGITMEGWAKEHHIGRTTFFDWKASRVAGPTAKGRVSTEKSTAIEEAIIADAQKLGLTTRTHSD